MSPVFLAPLIVACALFMESVDANIIVTALPAMARDFRHSPVTLNIAITAYVVGFGVFIPICGWLADRFSARSVFRTAIGIFVVGSLMCAASNSLGVLTFARFIQGVGGAMMVPVGRIIIFRAVPRSDLVRAMNYSLAIPALFGPTVGPLVGGFITTYLHWRMIFFINVPIGIYGIYLASKHIANTRGSDPGLLDWFGFLLSASGARAAADGPHADRRLAHVTLERARHVRGRHRLLALYVPYARRKATGARPQLPQDPHASRERRRRVAVPYRPWRGAVPATLALQEGARHERVPLGPSRARPRSAAR